MGVYVLGIFLNTKIITVSTKDKGMTWKIDVFNSSMLMIHYGHAIIMHGATFLIKDLYIYTGAWFCYASKSILIWGNAHTTGHSLMISLLKFVRIVHWKKARLFGEDKVARIFFWLNIVYPFYILAMFNIVRPDFLMTYDGISQANRCLGKSDILSSPDAKLPAKKLHNMCEIDVPHDQNGISFGYLVYAGRISLCWLNIVLAYSNVWNVLEGIIYCRVFHFMHR